MRAYRSTLLSAFVATAMVLPAAAVLTASPAAAAAPGPGDVVVVRVGDGSATLSSAATPVFLDEYAPDGSLVRTTPLPTSAAGANKPLTMSGSASSEGALALSADGRYLTLGGYGAAPGTASVASTTSAATPRVVARVDANAAVDTSTALTDASSGNNMRAAASVDGTGFFTGGGTGGARYATLGATTSTQLTTAPANVRTLGIAAGQLHLSSGSSPFTGVSKVGTGVPTTAGQTAALLAPAPSAYAFTFLDRSPAVPGVDTLYVADDSASPTGGVLKFSFDGTAWTARGSFRPAGSGARGLTGTVAPDGTVGLLATTTTGTGSLVRVTDTAAFDAPIAATGTTLVTAGANTAFRGVAYAPQGAVAPAAPAITTQPQDATITAGATATLTVAATGTDPLAYQWYQGATGDTSAPVAGATAASFTTPALTATTTYWVRVTDGAGTADSRTATVTVGAVPPDDTPPTISPNPVAPLALTLGDPDPPAARTVDVADAQSPADALTVSVSSSNPAVATGGATGGGATRTLTVTPVGVGTATLTATVSDGSLTASTTFPVGISGALPAGTVNHYGASDASTAVDLGGGAMVVGDDETNVLRTYDRAHSRYPAQSFDVRAAGLALRDADPTREIDIEASARTGNTIYWVGSGGQNSSGSTRLNRQELFATTVTGTGTAATLSLAGSYQHLRDDLIAWDQQNGNPLGLAAAATRAPEGSAGGATGFNIEGAELSADGQTLYLAFRGPLEGTKALVVPVTNVAALVTANPTTGVTATFGAPLLWDLGGRGIREIRRGGAGSYLVIAGPSDGGTGAAGEFRFYSWNGDPASAPVLRAGSLDQVAAPGKPESIVSVPDPLLDSSAVQVLTDSGDTPFYGDGVAAKDEPLELRKATSAQVAVGAPPACSTAPMTIGSVEGTGDVTPFAGQTVSVRGTVVGDYEGPSPALRGFYLQDAGDADPATSDAVFVFDNGADLVSNGDVVQVSGVASEFQGQTQITPPAGGVRSCGTRAVVTPVDITLPRADPADLEPYEGMLVRLHQTATVTEEFQLGRFGQVVVSSGGKLRQPTADIRATDRAAVTAAQNANNLNQLIIDDADQSQNPDPIVFGRGGQPLSAANTLRGGDTVTDAVGVLSYTWAGNAASGNAYRLRPVNALGGTAVFDPTNPRPTAPPAVGDGGVKVASSNLLNFFNTYTGCTFGVGGAATDCRGADNDAEYQRQLAKEVASITFLGADVVGFMEMENNGYGPGSAEQALVDALNAKDGPGAWGFVNPDAASGVTDSAGTDAIKAGLLYRTARVSPVAGATFVDQAAGVFERNPVGQTFVTPGGAKLTVVANHFKSKGSCPTSGPDTDQGDGQSCWNARRTAQATELARWVGATVVPGAGDPDVLLVGDLNSYAGEDPIAVLENAGYTNLVKKFNGPEAYSYDFGAQWGYLDYVMGSSSLTPQVTGAGDAHHNADEPTVLDYNTEFKTPGQVASLYAPDRFRTSDHDPVLTGIALGTAATVSGTPPGATVGQPYSFAFTTGGTGPVTVAVTDGALPPGLTLAADGTVTGTPTAGGSYPFSVRATGPDGSSALATSIAVAAAASTTTLTAAPQPVATGATLTLAATVAGPVPPTGSVTFSTGPMPLGSTQLGPDGTATFGTAALPAGTYPIVATYSGSPSLAGSASAPLTVTVLDPVQVGGTVPGGTVGQAYSAAVPSSAGHPDTFVVSKGALPPGLTLSTSGTISGTPTTAGTYAFDVTAGNAVSSATASYTIAIRPGATTLTVTSSRNPSPLLSSVTFTATVGGARPNPGGTVTFRAGNVPLGNPVPVVNTSASRSVPVLPVGTTTVTATYSGSGDYTGSSAGVAQTVLLPVVFLGTPPAGRLGTAYRFAFTATPGAVFSVSAGRLPAGLTLSPSGVLSGTPTARGTSAYTVRAANAVGAQDRAFTTKIG